MGTLLFVCLRAYVFNMQGYFSLSEEHRRKLLVALSIEYDLDRMQVGELMKQYLGLKLPDG